ncbi:kinase-like domain-containing protein [Butyriboletus roseoflavus]|nr:kinase-like domain-containing protein [Butyriboletus roseoflavus]
MGSTVASPIGSHFSHGSSDTTSSSTSESVPLTTPKGVNGASPSTAPKPKGGLAAEARMLTSTTDTFGGVDVESESGEENEACLQPSETPPLGSHASIPPSTHPLLAQLQPYITPRNPTTCFTNLVEIAEGESGSVFAACVVSPFADIQSHEGQQESTERPIPPDTSDVAIKRIPLPPLASSPSLSDNSPLSNKLVSVLHELCVLKNLDHEHLLLLDAVYVGSNSGGEEDDESASTVDTSLWIRMELMERSLADVIGLVAEGLALQERLVGRFASDILHGLDYLQRQHIAHRDVRSDNLLVNATGVVKLADFSNAIRVDRNASTVSGAVGVIYWQAPEMRAGPYDALKVDSWSLGATVWELAETVPPFSMPASPSTQVSFAIQTARHVGSQWPPLTHPEHYSRAFHEFLRLCGRESAGRPGPVELLNVGFILYWGALYRKLIHLSQTPFIRNACGRAVILQLLSQCRAIEEAMAAKEAFTG